MLDAVEAGILQDARERRLSGDPRRASCRPFPRGVEDREDPRRRSARYACLAVTADIPRSESNRAGIIGHPYRLLIDYGSGRYAFCKISGVPGEGSFRAKRPVTVPEACGG